MTLSYGEKQRFFSQLAQLLRSGAALPKALETLKRTGSGSARPIVKKMLRALDGDATASEAFATLNPEIGAMERATLSAAARSGRLDYTLNRLADYFQTLQRARRAILQQSAYPIFTLHLGILTWHAATLVTGGLGPYLRATLPILIVLWGAGLALAVFIPFLNDLGAHWAIIDEFLRDLPLFGKVRRTLSTARFCGTYDMQLDAGVNVIDSVLAAAGASHSGLIHRAVQRGLAKLRNGVGVSEVFADYRGALPREALESLIIAEETGDLHRTLPQLQSQYEEEGLHRLAVLAEWLPRMLYLGVACWVGWRVITFYQGYLGDIERQINS